MNAEAVKALVMAAIAALIFAAGWAVEGWRKDAEIAQIERAYTKQRAADLQQHLDDLTTAEALGRELVARLATSENALQTLAQEKDLEIRRLTVGRRCLDSAAVRVLNRSASLKPAAVPEAASEPVRADAAFATDTDVGIWIGICQRSYETCRGRLKAIADFYSSTEAPTGGGEEE